MQEIITAVKELGKLIQANESYKVMEVAREQVDNDDELQKAIGEFTLSKQALNQEISKEPRDEEKIKEYDDRIRALHKEIMQNPNMTAFDNAKNDFDEVVGKINQILTASINGFDPETADLEHNCGGGCSSCSGCH